MIELTRAEARQIFAELEQEEDTKTERQKLEYQKLELAKRRLKLAEDRQKQQEQKQQQTKETTNKTGLFVVIGMFLSLFAMFIFNILMIIKT